MQTINCLELWAKLLAAKADEPELRPLIYPVTQARTLLVAVLEHGCTHDEHWHATCVTFTTPTVRLLQLLLGVARLVPAPAYFPLRLRCARALNRLGEATSTFIPVAPVLLEVLQWSDLRKAPKPSTGQHPDVLLQLRVSKANLRSAQYQEEVIGQVSAKFIPVPACAPWHAHCDLVATCGACRR